MPISSIISDADHPKQVLEKLVDFQLSGLQCALVVVTGTEGGAIRDNGALMVVPLDGKHVGYISNGCVDNDVAFNARQFINTKKSGTLRYGEGSPFMDIHLPCGGAINLGILVNPDPIVVSQSAQALLNRQPISLKFNFETNDITIDRSAKLSSSYNKNCFTATYNPITRIRVAGRGPEMLTLARFSSTMGYDVIVQSPDLDALESAKAIGITEVIQLKSTATPTPFEDDQWTAFVLMFHDHDWEQALLTQALKNTAFYIGALGSKKTHQTRIENLKNSGLNQTELNRIKGPIGLVPSQRSAAGLAISILAEILATSQIATLNSASL